MAIANFTASKGVANAYKTVLIREVSSGKLAQIFTSSGSLLNEYGVATLDSSGSLSVYLDTARTWSVDVTSIPVTLAWDNSSLTQAQKSLGPSGVPSYVGGTLYAPDGTAISGVGGGVTTYAALSDASSVNLPSVNAPLSSALSTKINASAVNAAAITDSTSTGRSLITAANAAAALTVLGALPANSAPIQVSSNIVLNSGNTSTYAGQMLEVTGNFTITVNAGHGNYAFGIIAPAAASCSLVSDGTVTFNGATTTITMAAGTIYSVVGRNNPNSLVVKGG